MTSVGPAQNALTSFSRSWPRSAWRASPRRSRRSTSFLRPSSSRSGRRERTCRAAPAVPRHVSRHVSRLDRVFSLPPPFPPRQAFTLDQPDGLHRLYSPKHGAHAEDDRNIIMRLTSVCHHLGEAPVVRYSRCAQGPACGSSFTRADPPLAHHSPSLLPPSNASDRTMKLAMDLQKNIDMLETAKSARADVRGPPPVP